MKLTEIMKEKKVSSVELSERTGIKKTTIENYRQERRDPSLRNGLKIADALGIDPHELLDNE